MGPKYCENDIHQVEVWLHNWGCAEKHLKQQVSLLIVSVHSVTQWKRVSDHLIWFLLPQLWAPVLPGQPRSSCWASLCWSPSSWCEIFLSSLNVLWTKEGNAQHISNTKDWTKHNISASRSAWYQSEVWNRTLYVHLSAHKSLLAGREQEKAVSFTPCANVHTYHIARL